LLVDGPFFERPSRNEDDMVVRLGLRGAASTAAAVVKVRLTVRSSLCEVDASFASGCVLARRRALFIAEVPDGLW
jgi:hypothetical protein